MTSESKGPDSWTLAIMPQFLDMTASRQIEIDLERDKLDAGQDPHLCARDIGKIAHKIAGTAASFGFLRLGVQAQAVERACTQVSTLWGADLEAAVRLRLIPALDALTQELDLVLVTSL